MSKLRKLFGKKEEVKLAEPPKLRSSAEIQQEYTNLCARLGNLDYLIYVHEGDRQLLREQARTLNNEGAKAQQQEQLDAAAKKKESEDAPKA